MTKVFLAVSAVILALMGWHAVRALTVAGAFVSLEELATDQCVKIDIAPGAEDITIDRETGIAFVSASDRRGLMRGDANQGGIYVLNIVGEPEVRLASTDAPADFQPHGISFWHGKDGAKRLLVVSHPIGGGHRIELFDIGEAGMLSHVETIAFEEIHSPNDIAATGPRSFYVTNDHARSDTLLAKLEGPLILPVTNAVYFDGEEGRSVVDGLNYANGINITDDGKTVYIAEVLGRQIGVYSRDRNTNDLTKEKMLKIPTNPDNIEIDLDGNLWTGAHPQAFEYLKHAKDETYPAPGQVMRIDPTTGDYESVYISLDGNFPATTVAAVSGSHMFVGSVFNREILKCAL